MVESSPSSSSSSCTSCSSSCTSCFFGKVSFAGETIFLQVSLFLAVSASGVGVPQDGVGAGLVVAVGTIVTGRYFFLQYRHILMYWFNIRSL